MSRFNQTIARIASGLTVIGALIWLLWPYDLQFINNPEAWFVLCTAVVVWLATEFKQSEALIALKPTKSDEQFARRLVDLHQGKLRHLLLDADLWRHVDVEIYRGMWSLIEDFENGRIFFSNKKIQNQLNEFVEVLKQLSVKVSLDTVQESFNGAIRIGYKPTTWIEEGIYDEQFSECKKSQQIANTAWRHFEELVHSIRVFVPDAYVDQQA